MGYPWLAVPGVGYRVGKMLVLSAQQNAETKLFRAVLTLRLPGKGAPHGSFGAVSPEDMKAAVEKRFPGLTAQYEAVAHMIELVPDVIRQAEERVRAEDEARRAKARALADATHQDHPSESPVNVLVLDREDVRRLTVRQV